MISVIVCSIDDKKFGAVDYTYRKLLSADGHECEVIRIPDARSMCEGYNRGFAQRRERRDQHHAIRRVP